MSNIAIENSWNWLINSITTTKKLWAREKKKRVECASENGFWLKPSNCLKNDVYFALLRRMKFSIYLIQFQHFWWQFSCSHSFCLDKNTNTYRLQFINAGSNSHCHEKFLPNNGKMCPFRSIPWRAIFFLLFIRCEEVEGNQFSSEKLACSRNRKGMKIRV